MAFEITQGDLDPPMTIDLTDDGAVADVHAATGPLTMRWFKPDGTFVEGITITNVNLTIGQVLRVWTSGDTDIPGVHRAQIVVPMADGDESFPTDGTWIRWIVRPKLSSAA